MNRSLLLFLLTLDHRVGSLELARKACEEINRDRDPADWSRLVANRELLDVLEADDKRDRGLLQRQLADTSDGEE